MLVLSKPHLDMRVVEGGESCRGVSSVREAVLQSTLHHVVVVEPGVGAHHLLVIMKMTKFQHNDDDGDHEVVVPSVQLFL